MEALRKLRFPVAPAWTGERLNFACASLKRACALITPPGLRCTKGKRGANGEYKQRPKGTQVPQQMPPWESPGARGLNRAGHLVRRWPGQEAAQEPLLSMS